MTALPSFIASGTLKDLLPGMDEEPMDEAVVTFFPGFGRRTRLVWGGVTEHLERPVLGFLDLGGVLVGRDGDPLRLLARHSALVNDLQWQVRITTPIRVLSWWFPAGSDGDTVDLSTTAPAPVLKTRPIAGAGRARLIIAPLSGVDVEQGGTPSIFVAVPIVLHPPTGTDHETGAAPIIRKGPTVAPTTGTDSETGGIPTIRNGPRVAPMTGTDHETGGVPTITH